MDQILKKEVITILKPIPTGIKIISVLDFISAGFLLLASFGFLIGSGFLLYEYMSPPEPTIYPGDSLFANLNNEFEESWRDSNKWLLLTTLSTFAITLIFGILNLLVGKGLRTGRGWARTYHVVIGSIGTLYLTYTVYNGEYFNIVSILISGLIIGYLGLNKNAKLHFNIREDQITVKSLSSSTSKTLKRTPESNHP